MSNYRQFRILKSNAGSMIGRPQKGMRKPKSSVSFETWMLLGIKRIQWYGAEIELLEPSMVRIQFPGKPAILRTIENFRDEYENEYLPKFQPSDVFEEGAGTSPLKTEA